MVKKPYKILDAAENWEIRLFENFQLEELVWHRDKENREVELLEGDCKLQIDNELPKEMKFNKKYFIEQMIYHRVISDGSSFKVKIFKK